MLFSSLPALLLTLFSSHVAAKAVFAHFMVDNSGDYDQSAWKTDMILASTVGIDAFALNIASGNSINDDQVANAFAAAESFGFQLFFSFDYAGNGAWDKSAVISMIQKYQGSSAYFLRDGQPFVSTFEGPDSAADWVDIKSETGCFFIPDWSSIDAASALQLGDGVADGLFSWAAWSWGGDAMNTYSDASYVEFLDGKPYMMPASPWFYTNLPGYNKNWMWPVLTMDLWEQRWTEILFTQPDYVEIISWNDFGESHYIGNTASSPPFENGDATYDYVTGMEHDGWRYQLLAWASMYKTGKATITDELITASYLIHHVEDCSDGNTTVNTASQLQLEYAPSDVIGGSYYISYTALLGSEADVTISVGGTTISGPWTSKPVDGVGVYHGTAYIGTDTGDVVVTLQRDGSAIATISGKAIGGCTDKGYANLNPTVGVTFADGSISATTVDVGDLVCTEGTGAPGFAGICGITCSYGYCPIGACVCTELGTQKTLPKATGLAGYAKNNTNYIGMCSWAYTYGFKDNDAVTPYCTSTEQTLSTPAVSQFLPTACTAGESNGEVGGSDINALCSFSCNYGYCPIHLCKCTSTGSLTDLPAVSDTSSDRSAAVQWADNSYVADTCSFACEYGYCPLDVCYSGGVVSTELSTGPWDSVGCNYGSLASDLNPGYERWADAQAEGDWAALLSYFKDYASTADVSVTDSGTTYNGFQFSQIIADAVHATSDRLCEFVPNTECDTTVPCDDQLGHVATGVATPAGYVIINSIANIHSLLDEIYNAIENAVEDYQGLTSTLVDAFEDIADDSKIKLALDIVNLLYGLIAAPFWNSWLKNSLGDEWPGFANTAGTIQSSISAIMSGATSFIKDALSSTQGIDQAIAFSALATTMGQDMQSAIVSNAQLLFSGNDTSVLNGLMTNGTSVGLSSSISPTVMTNSYYKALVALSLPIAWEANAVSGSGFFWMTGEGLGDSDADITTCSGATAAAKEEFDLLEFYGADNAFVCDTATDTPYWLTYVGRTCTYLSHEFLWECVDGHQWEAPPGTDKLNGTYFGGLTKTDLLMSSVNAYVANGNANGWSAPDLTKFDTVADIAENGVQAAGVFNAPICSWTEASKNWKNQVVQGNYPCN